MMKHPYNTKADLLALTVYEEEGYAKAYRWNKIKRLWTHHEPSAKNIVFAATGVSAQGALFTMHPSPLTPHNLLEYQGEYYFITRVLRTSPVQMEVQGAQVNIFSCTSKWVKEAINPDTKLMEYTHTKLLFPAVLTEKYLGYEKQEPMVKVIKTFVLVTPKEIILEESDIVYVEDQPYVVVKCHLLGNYKHEYEVTREGDAS